MTTLFENEHPLVTPSFVGTDEEKIQVLGYWAGLIGFLRSLNAHVISHENKLAIIAQLKAELEIINVEVNNVTAHMVNPGDGANEMSTMPVGGDVANPDLVTVNATSPAPSVAPPAPRVVDLAEPENKFNPKATATEAMQRLAGNYYASRVSKKK